MEVRFTRRRLPCFAAIVLMLCQTQSAIGGTILGGVDDSIYLELATQSEYDAVGAVSWTEAGASYSGSGTYIGDGWVLTAAHVADGTDFAGGGNVDWEFTIAENTYYADAFVVHPEWTASQGELSIGVDLALVQLTSDITEVAPATLYDGADEEDFTATLVGYGATGTGESGYSSHSSRVMRAGQNEIDAVGEYRLVEAYSDSILFTDFDNPRRRSDNRWGSSDALDMEYMTDPDDSGGGLFLEVDGVDYLAGVTSFGLALDGRVDSDYGDVGGYIRTSQFVDWIEEVTGVFAGLITDDLAGDYNGDGIVDAADYSVWRDSLGDSVPAGAGEDGDGSGVVDAGDPEFCAPISAAELAEAPE